MRHLCDLPRFHSHSLSHANPPQHINATLLEELETAAHQIINLEEEVAEL